MAAKPTKAPPGELAVSGPASPKQAWLLEKQLNAKKRMMELGAMSDFAGAATAQAEAAELEQQLSAQTAASSVALLEEQLAVKHQEMNELAKAEDFVSAAAAQKEIEEMEKQLRGKARSSSWLQPLPTPQGQTAASSAALLEEQLAAKRQEMIELAEAHDYVGVVGCRLLLTSGRCGV